MSIKVHVRDILLFYLSWLRFLRKAGTNAMIYFANCTNYLLLKYLCIYDDNTIPSFRDATGDVDG